MRAIQKSPQTRSTVVPKSFRNYPEVAPESPRSRLQVAPSRPHSHIRSTKPLATAIGGEVIVSISSVIHAETLMSYPNISLRKTVYTRAASDAHPVLELWNSAGDGRSRSAGRATGEGPGADPLAHRPRHPGAHPGARPYQDAVPTGEFGRPPDGPKGWRVEG